MKEERRKRIISEHMRSLAAKSHASIRKNNPDHWKHAVNKRWDKVREAKAALERSNGESKSENV